MQFECLVDVVSCKASLEPYYAFPAKNCISFGCVRVYVRRHSGGFSYLKAVSRISTHSESE